jgi:hypothetical protein
MINFEIGIAILFSCIVLAIVINLANKSIHQRGQKITFEDTTTWPGASSSTPAAAPVQPTIIETPKDTGTNFHSVTVAIYIPLMLSLVSGLFAALLALIITKIWWSWADAFIAFGITFLLVAVAVWIWRLLDWSKLIHQIEVFTHADLDGDGYQGEPSRYPAVPVIIKRYSNGAYAGETQVGTLDITDDEKKMLAVAKERGIPFSENEFCRKHNWMSQPRCKQVRAQLLAAGLLASKGQGSGNDWTDLGIKYLSDAFPPSPTVESAPLPHPVGR